ncbi:MAG: fibronectin type III domain-containing protein, partial [Candidatus Krumholzibacteria bacterium]|nr:fibronectin type III domain-containing protein [Candidatus Krumholzibacteria bacterium]
DSLMTAQPWLDFVTVAPYRLSSGDGPKQVYAQFLDETGNPTHVVSSSIILDTFAEISTLSFACAAACVDVDTIAPGGKVHFLIQPTGAELDGFARVFIEGLGETPVIVRDDGRFGDPVAGNGSYEIDYVFPQFFRQSSMRMSAVFVDRAENESPEVEFAGTLYMSDPPAAVTLLQPAATDTTSITVRWSRSQDTHFARYEVYRDTAPTVTPAQSILAGQVTNIATTTFQDGGLARGTSYYYRVYVVNDLDERVGSNTLQMSTLP